MKKLISIRQKQNHQTWQRLLFAVLAVVMVLRPVTVAMGPDIVFVLTAKVPGVSAVDTAPVRAVAAAETIPALTAGDQVSAHAPRVAVWAMFKQKQETRLSLRRDKLV